jgi:hypothetical protein
MPAPRVVCHVAAADVKQPGDGIGQRQDHSVLALLAQGRLRSGDLPAALPAYFIACGITPRRAGRRVPTPDPRVIRRAFSLMPHAGSSALDRRRVCSRISPPRMAFRCLPSHSSSLACGPAALKVRVSTGRRLHHSAHDKARRRPGHARGPSEKPVSHLSRSADGGNGSPCARWRAVPAGIEPRLAISRRNFSTRPRRASGIVVGHVPPRVSGARTVNMPTPCP